MEAIGGESAHPQPLYNTEPPQKSSMNFADLFCPGPFPNLHKLLGNHKIHEA